MKSDEKECVKEKLCFSYDKIYKLLKLCKERSILLKADEQPAFKKFQHYHELLDIMLLPRGIETLMFKIEKLNDIKREKIATIEKELQELKEQASQVE